MTRCLKCRKSSGTDRVPDNRNAFSVAGQTGDFWLLVTRVGAAHLRS